MYTYIDVYFTCPNILATLRAPAQLPALRPQLPCATRSCRDLPRRANLHVRRLYIHIYIYIYIYVLYMYIYIYI